MKSNYCITILILNEKNIVSVLGAAVISNLDKFPFPRVISDTTSPKKSDSPTPTPFSIHQSGYIYLMKNDDLLGTNIDVLEYGGRLSPVFTGGWTGDVEVKL